MVGRGGSPRRYNPSGVSMRGAQGFTWVWTDPTGAGNRPRLRCVHPFTTGGVKYIIPQGTKRQAPTADTRWQRSGLATDGFPGDVGASLSY